MYIIKYVLLQMDAPILADSLAISILIPFISYLIASRFSTADFVTLYGLCLTLNGTFPIFAYFGSEIVSHLKHSTVHL